MELDEETFLDELMSLRREASAAAPWQAGYPGGGGGVMMSDLLFYGGGDAAGADSSVGAAMDMSPFQELAPMPAPQRPHEDFNFDCLSEVCNPYRSCVAAVPGEAAPGQSQTTLAAPLQQDAMAEEEMSGDKEAAGHYYGGGGSPTFVFGGGAGESSEMAIRGGVVGVPHHRSKLHGAPSKNLMAERRRRKRLNDRLSMLRSIVPKISKMDRTSILGDTIDYVKELTERIKVLEQEIGASPEDLDLLNTLKDSSNSSNEMMVRNSTKFDVEKRGNGSTRIEICCPTNPGVLLSTVSALEVLGLEIEQCVVSCFSDFGMRASCLQEDGKRQIISTDEIKQALFRSAGYGGRCL
ncbi:unnamed protein product [Urochloa humidicola]